LFWTIAFAKQNLRLMEDEFTSTTPGLLHPNETNDSRVSQPRSNSMKNQIHSATWSNAIRMLVFVAGAGVVLFSTTAFSQDLSKVQGETETWVRDAQSIYRLDCESKKKIWEALCGLLDPEDGEEYNVIFAKDIAYQLQQDEKSKVEPVLSKLKELRKNIEDLSKDSKNESVLVQRETPVGRKG
jgi:ATP-dependent Clp protease ATP-binding subunit ClpA